MSHTPNRLSPLSISLLVLVMVSIACGEDEPTLSGVDIEVVYSNKVIPEETRRRIDRFLQRLDSRHYQAELSTETDPQRVLAASPAVELVVAGQFEPDSMGVLDVTLYWRETNSSLISGSMEVNDIADRVIEFIEQEYVQADLSVNLLAHPESGADTRITQATRLYQTNQVGRAAELATEVLNDHQDDEDAYRAHLLLGHWHKQNLRYEKAAESFASADELAREDDRAALEIGNVRYLTHQYRGALEKYNKVISDGGMNEIKARANKILVLISMDRLDEAEAVKNELPESVVYKLSGLDLSGLLGAARLKSTRREKLYSYASRGLAGAAVVVVIAMIYMMYRRAQRDPDLTAAQRLDFAGKVMGGLFGMLSLLGGTMLGMFLAR